MQSRHFAGFALVLGLVSGCSTLETAPPKEHEPRVDDLAWISGSWISESSTGVSEEHWTKPRAGSMIGINREITKSPAAAEAQGKERTTFFEFLRIEDSPQGLVYLASPKGRSPATPFTVSMMVSEPPRVTFSNPEHDFPQRIMYWREGENLHARIEGTQDGKDHAEEWTWQPLKK